MTDRTKEFTSIAYEHMWGARQKYDEMWKLIKKLWLEFERRERERKKQTLNSFLGYEYTIIPLYN